VFLEFGGSRKRGVVLVLARVRVYVELRVSVVSGTDLFSIYNRVRRELQPVGLQENVTYGSDKFTVKSVRGPKTTRAGDRA
jgi:hypothetical protein